MIEIIDLFLTNFENDDWSDIENKFTNQQILSSYLALSQLANYKESEVYEIFDYFVL